MACSGEMIDCEVCQCRHPADFACEPVEGLSPFAARALGFDQMCQCGHEDGMHMTPGMECAVLECQCSRFTPCSGKGEA